MCLFILNCAQAAVQDRQDTVENYDQISRWIHFTTASGLPSNHTYDVIQSQSGVYWVSTNRGLAYFDGYRWQAIDSSKGLPEEAPSFVSRGIGDSISVTFSGKTFAGTPNGFRRMAVPINESVHLTEQKLLVRINYTTRIYENGIVRESSDAPENTTGRVIQMWEGNDHRIWVWGLRGLYSLEDNHYVRKIAPAATKLQISNVRENSRGNGLVSVSLPPERRGLWDLSKDGMLVRDAQSARDFPQCFDIAPNNDIILVHLSGDIYLRRNGVWKNLPSMQSMIRKNIESVRFTDNGDLWVAGEQGLYYCPHTDFRWTFFRHQASDPRNRIHTIVLSKSKDIWLGTANGIDILKPDGHTQSILSVLGTTLYEVTGIEEDTSGNIWISSGSTFSGTYRWDGKQWKHFELMHGNEPAYIHAIQKDSKGNLWFMGMLRQTTGQFYDEPGVYEYSHGTFRQFSVSTYPLLTRMYCMAESKDGSLWFGSSQGLTHYADGTWSGYLGTKYTWNPVFSIAVDDNRTVWICDRSNGVHSVDSAGRIRNYSTYDGLIDNRVWGVANGNDQKVWFATRNGLASYDNGVWSVFDERSGLNKSDLWPVVVRDSLVYTGSNGGGLAILHLNDAASPPVIQMSNAAINGRDAYLQWRPYSYWMELAPQEIETRYRLNSGDWSTWKPVHEILLHKLAPGEYRFQVQAKSLFGKFNPEGVTTEFVILPPLYLQWGFLLPVGGSAIMVIALATRSVQRKRRHDRALRLSEAKFRRLTEATFEGIMLYRNGVVIDSNPSAERIFGYDSHGLIGKHIIDFIAPSDRPGASTNLESDREKPFEVCGLRSDGTTITLEIIPKAIPSEEKGIQVAAIRDITERKETEHRLAEYQENLRSLASELSLTEERERRHMATYLHDSIGQTLAFCRIKLGLLREANTAGGLESDWEELRETLDQSIADTRSLTFELSPPLVHELSIIDALDWLIEQIAGKYKFEILLEGESPSIPLPGDLRMLLFRGIRELLINAGKHADADKVLVTTREADGMYSISVWDNGIGFDLEDIDRRKSKGFGLFNIRERVQYLGGTFVVSSKKGSGTTITISVPMPPQVASEKP